MRRIMAFLHVVLFFSSCEEEQPVEDVLETYSCAAWNETNHTSEKDSDPDFQFSAAINGEDWAATSGVSAYTTMVAGNDDQFGFSFNFGNIRVRKYDGESNDYSRGTLIRSNVVLDTVNRLVSFDFEGTIFDNHDLFDTDSIQITNGHVVNLPYSSQEYSKPEFFVTTGERELTCIWDVVEVYDCESDTTHYPLTGFWSLVNFTNENKLLAFSGTNTRSGEYAWLNDSTISAPEYISHKAYGPGMEFEGILFQATTGNELVLRKKNNLLEIVNLDNGLSTRLFKR